MTRTKPAIPLSRDLVESLSELQPQASQVATDVKICLLYNFIAPSHITFNTFMTSTTCVTCITCTARHHTVFCPSPWAPAASLSSVSCALICALQDGFDTGPALLNAHEREA